MTRALDACARCVSQGVGVKYKEDLFLERFRGEGVGAALLQFPSWNASACRTWRRTVRLPAEAGGVSTVDVSYVAHCVDASAVPPALVDALRAGKE